MHPYRMPMAELEAVLYRLYSHTNLDDATRMLRADFARAYHDRTGRYYAARFY